MSDDGEPDGRQRDPARELPDLAGIVGWDASLALDRPGERSGGSDSRS